MTIDRALVEEKPGVAILLTVLFLIIFVVSLFGNSLVIHTVRSTESMWVTVNILVVNLSVSDLIFILLHLPRNIAHLYYAERWLPGTHGRSLCKLNHFVVGLTFCSSLFSILALSIDRFLAVVRPIQHKTLGSNWLKKAVPVIWIISLALPIRTATDADTACVKNITVCVSAEVDYAFMAVVWCLYLVQLIAMAVLYSIVVYKLWNRRILTGSGAVTRQTVTNQRTARRVTAMLITVVLAFAICWLPMVTLMTMKATGLGAHMSIRHVNNIFMISHGALHPVIYFVFNENFRKKFRQLTHTWLTRGIRFQRTADSRRETQRVRLETIRGRGGRDNEVIVLSVIRREGVTLLREKNSGHSNGPGKRKRREADTEGHTIDTNDVNSSSDAGHDDGHATDIAGKATDITGHTTVITDHATDIAGHAANTAGHAANTAGHATNTAGHATDIAGHAANTAGHETAIAGHATNTAGHATETAGHATNTGGHETVIARHAADIAGHAINTVGQSNKGTPDDTGRSNGQTPDNAQHNERTPDNANYDRKESHKIRLCNGHTSNDTQCNGRTSDDTHNCNGQTLDDTQCNGQTSDSTQCNGKTFDDNHKCNGQTSDATQCNGKTFDDTQCNGQTSDDTHKRNELSFDDKQCNGQRSDDTLYNGQLSDNNHTCNRQMSQDTHKCNGQPHVGIKCDG
ncbi:melatonin-related receptor isoform X2 [Nematostella vectensis]|nr:melatonin-related receptor isoform X2 [Nematostella vectensis]XP_032232064.2 melatonin-related receptor isoform X2 [Nematostella vectensis]XP_048581573.1 melatonin-related receptor isoform X2 [Nematostella vectensis]